MIVEQEIARLSTDVQARLKWLVEMESTPYTQNLHYFSDYRDKFLTRFKAQRKVSLVHDLSVDYLDS